MKRLQLRSCCVSMVTVLALAVQTVVPAAAESIDDHRLTQRYPAYEEAYGYDDQAPYYRDYYADGKENGYQDTAGVSVDIDLSAAYIPEGDAAAEGYDPAQKSYIWEKGGPEKVAWRFEVPQDGYYCLRAAYTARPGTVDSPRRALTIDGKAPYRELSNIVFARRWRDAGEPSVNLAGDQVRPRQEEVYDEQTMWVYDALGWYEEPLRLYLEAGVHSIEMEYIQDGFALSALSVVSPPVLPTYEEKLASWRDAGIQNADQSIKVDGERPAYKSESSIRLDYSSDPLADPPSDGHYILNAMGGAGWSGGGESITWSFDAPQDGLYKLDIRLYTKYNDGLSVYRQIALDGEVPFREFASYAFAYGGWNTASVCDENGDPFLVYLEEGPHTLTLTVKNTGYADMLYHMESTLDSLSKVLQNIIMITGIEPDVNFDYQLFEQIPWLKSELEAISASLNAQIEALSAGEGKTPSTANSLSTIRYRVDQFIRDPFSIARNLDNIIEDQTTLSSWLKEFNNSPMMVDYFTFSPPEADVGNPQANVFQVIGFAIRDFFLSFTRDYTSIAGLGHDGTAMKTITGWVSRGKEWSEILKQITDEDFTPAYGINVEFNMLPAGQLGTGGIMLLAVSSGTAPDFVLGTDSTTPAEYGMRGVVADLRSLPGYEEVEERFLDGVITPYRFQEQVYGLPETMDFSVLYYRKDILSTLNIRLPETWEDLYHNVLPELRRNGMDFWYEGGLNTFLFQNGASFYTPDGRRSALDSQEAYTAFKQFSDLYKVYDVPVSANFYTRFRAGQMPIGISSFSTYLQLTSAAPELEGKWGAYLIPGTQREGGTIDRSNSVGSTGLMIFSGASDVEAAWEFAKWYTSAETQTRYAGDLVAYIGSEAKWCSANVEAFDSLSWDSDFQKVIEQQRDWGKGMPSVVGGYITARHIENARVRTVIQGMNPRESIEKAARDITRELEMKNNEFERRQAAE